MPDFKFRQIVDSDDFSVRGKIVYDKEGNEYVAYYSDEKKVELIKIDYYLHDWEIVKEK